MVQDTGGSQDIQSKISLIHWHKSTPRDTAYIPDNRKLEKIIQSSS